MFGWKGRQEALDEVSAQLRGGRAVIAAVSGMGGVGKSQLALEYAHRHLARYSHIAWLRAEKPSTLAGELDQWADQLGLPGQTHPEKWAALQRWLMQNDDWLMIFDNAPDPEGLEEFLPQGNGHRLITSRHRRWDHAVALDVLPLADAVQLLRERSGRLQDPDAETLAATLGCLPLALEQAAAYIEDAKIPFATYLSHYQQHRLKLLGKGVAKHHKDGVAVTWVISMERAAASAPAALEILRFAAFLDPDAIPRDLPLRAGLVADELALFDALAALARYSLITLKEETISLHRLMQEAVRHGLSEEERKEWAGRAVRVMREVYNFGQNDLSTWEASGRLLPHAQAAADWGRQLEVEEEGASWLWNETGLYLKNVQTRYGDAKQSYRRALALDEKNLGPDHPKVAIDLNNLAALHQAEGDLKGARPLMERALEIDEKNLGPDHPTVAIRLSNLAQLHQDEGDLKGARPLMERALAIDEKNLGPDHPGVARDLNNLAQLHQAEGDLKGARPLMERALAIDEKHYGPDHPKVATDLNNLALLHQAEGDLKGARPLMVRALAIDEKHYGPDHPNVARDLNNLATLHQAEGDLKGARPLMERALAIDEKNLGSDHPKVATRLNNLAQLHQAEGDLKGARPLMERALAIDEKNLGPDHPNVARDLNNLAQLHQAEGDLKGARPLMERALQIAEDRLGMEHPHTVIFRRNLENLRKLMP
ncbi:MAG: tetratricopeptide repeat protein [Magnetococcales bacterium]|nr:tetratricopeptide repeat protein [Magnetococcales bacterium]